MWKAINSEWMVVDSQPIEGWSAVAAKRNMRGYPAVLGRLPLFLPLPTRVKVETPLEASWGTVVFSNLCLNSHDEDLFIALLAANGIFQGTLADLSRTANNTSKMGLLKSIEALMKNHIEVAARYKGVEFRFSGTLASSFKGEGKTCELRLDERLVCLTEMDRKKHHYRNLDMDIRQGLSLNGKALHRFLSCHKPEGTYTLSVLREAIAPLQREDNFKRKISQQLERMKELGFLKSYALNRDKLKYCRF